MPIPGRGHCLWPRGGCSCCDRASWRLVRCTPYQARWVSQVAVADESSQPARPRTQLPGLKPVRLHWQGLLAVYDPQGRDRSLGGLLRGRRWCIINPQPGRQGRLSLGRYRAFTAQPRRQRGRSALLHGLLLLCAVCEQDWHACHLHCCRAHGPALAQALGARHWAQLSLFRLRWRCNTFTPLVLLWLGPGASAARLGILIHQGLPYDSSSGTSCRDSGTANREDTAQEGLRPAPTAAGSQCGCHPLQLLCLPRGPASMTLGCGITEFTCIALADRQAGHNNHRAAATASQTSYT